MTSKTTRKFRRLLTALPAEIQDSANATYLQFSENPSHPSLRFKKVHASEPVYSARVTIDYRVLGVVSGDTIVWFWIGKHADYEKIVNNL